MKINETLNGIAKAKADMKSALAQCDIKAGDIFAEYPQLIKAVGIVNDELFNQYFEKCDDYFIEDIDGWKIFYTKYKYRFGDETIKGPEDHREENKGTLVLDVETVDGSEITITDFVGTNYTTSGGKLYMDKPSWYLLDSKTNWDKIKNVNYINLQWLPGGSVEYAFSGSSSSPNTNLENVYEWITADGDVSLSNMFAYCDSLKTINITANENLTSLYNFCLYCGALKNVEISGTSKVTNFNYFIKSTSSKAPHIDSVTFDVSSATNMNNMFDYVYIREINFKGRLNNIASGNYNGWYREPSVNEEYSLKTINGLDISQVTHSILLYFLGSSTITAYKTLENMIVEGVGVSYSSSIAFGGSSYFPQNWNRYDYFKTISLMANSDNGRLSFYNSDEAWIWGAIWAKGYTVGYNTSGSTYATTYSGRCDGNITLNAGNTTVKTNTLGSNFTLSNKNIEEELNIPSADSMTATFLTLNLTGCKFTGADFTNGTGLKKISVSGSSLKTMSFSGLNLLEEIYLPDDVSELWFKTDAFRGCSSLKYIFNLKPDSLPAQNIDLSECQKLDYRVAVDILEALKPSDGRHEIKFAGSVATDLEKVKTLGELASSKNFNISYE